MGFIHEDPGISLLILLIRDHLKKPFDLIHAHCTFPTGFSAIVLQKLFRVPMLLSLDGGEEVSFPEIKFGDVHQSKRTRINKWIINRAKVVTALTCFHRDLIYKNLTISRTIEVVTRGVDTGKFPRSAAKKIDSPIKFLSVGYLSPINRSRNFTKSIFSNTTTR